MRAEVILRLFCQFQLSFSLFWQDRRFVAERAPNADPPEKNPKRKYKLDGVEWPSKFPADQPTATQHDVLRLHGLIWHVDWMETLAIHPRYRTQAEYFARVPSTYGSCSGPPPIAHSDFARVLQSCRASLRRHAGGSARQTTRQGTFCCSWFRNKGRTSTSTWPGGMRPCRMYSTA